MKALKFIIYFMTAAFLLFFGWCTVGMLMIGYEEEQKRVQEEIDKELARQYQENREALRRLGKELHRKSLEKESKLGKKLLSTEYE